LLVVDSVNIGPLLLLTAAMKNRHLERKIRWSLAPRPGWPKQMSGLVLPHKREDFQAGAENLGGE
jgi:hypothetical protein